jgi:hypothetical protein
MPRRNNIKGEANYGPVLALTEIVLATEVADGDAGSTASPKSAWQPPIQSGPFSAQWTSTASRPPGLSVGCIEVRGPED